MIIGVPKEIKNNENRVGMTPSGVAEVVKQGHRVFIQHTAGVNSGFPDEAYQAVGAHVLPTIEDIYATAEMIVKVKEPIVTEYNLIRKGLESESSKTSFCMVCLDTPNSNAKFAIFS